MKNIILISILILVHNSAFGQSYTNPSVIWGANGRALVLPTNGFEFTAGETLSGEDVLGMKNTTSTGHVSGGIVTIGAPTSTVNITAGVGYVVDNTSDPANPVMIRVEYGPFVNEPITTIGASVLTVLYIDSSGNLVQDINLPTPDKFRDQILIGALSHPDLATIQTVIETKVPMIDAVLGIKDLSDAIGIINLSGNVFSAGGANLTIQKNAGATYEFGATADLTPKNPSTKNHIALAPVTSFTYWYADGIGGHTLVPSSTVIDPENYDDGSGTLVAVPNNRYSVQRIYFRPSIGIIDVVYGADVYVTIAGAESAIFGEVTDISVLVSAGSSLRGWLIVKKGNTDLTDIAEVKFIEAGKFGETIGGGSSSATTTLQVAYENSVQPQIILDATRLGFQIRDAFTPIASPLFEILSNDGLSTYFEVGAALNTSISLDVEGRFQVISTTEPSLPCPVMTEAERDLTAPIGGDCVYNTDSLSLEYFDATAWVIVRPSGIPVMAKGTLFASDGAQNGEFGPCADGEILEWDAAETTGFKCSSVPVLTLPKYQVKTLASDINSGVSNVSSWEWNNLTITSDYEVCTFIYANHQVSTAPRVRVLNGGTTVKDMYIGVGDGNLFITFYTCSTFTATATTLRTSTNTMVSSQNIRGNGTRNESFQMLREVFYEETTDFN